MKKFWIVMLILGLVLGGSSCGRSTEKSKADYSTEKSEEELNLMERELIEDEKLLEKEYKVEEEVMEEERAEVSDEEWGDEDEYPDI